LGRQARRWGETQGKIKSDQHSFSLGKPYGLEKPGGLRFEDTDPRRNWPPTEIERRNHGEWVDEMTDELLRTKKRHEDHS